MAAPTDITLSVSPVEVFENSAVNTVIATITGVDADTSAGSLSFSLLNNAGGRFKIINGNQLAVANSLTIDYEQQASFEVLIQVSDGSGTYSEAFTIVIKDVVSETVTGSTGADLIVSATTNGHDSLSGGQGNDTLRSGHGNDTLVGGDGTDTMEGGEGNDAYSVDNVADYVMDDAFFNGGTDIIYSSVSYSLQYTKTETINGVTKTSTLPIFVENLTLSGTAVSATGSSLKNRLVGNDADNIIDGKGADDTMLGGKGNDSYYVDEKTDVVVEIADEGTDTVYASDDYSLTSTNVSFPLRHVENLILVAGKIGLDGTGNALQNIISGNEYANKIDGQGDADTMVGGGGNDTYYVDVSGDVVTESASTTDTRDEVVSSISYTLGSNVEYLTLTGTAANGTGNSAKNQITGNGSANLIDGGIGADTMKGGGGNDTYVIDFDAIANRTLDSIVELTGGGTDTVRAAFTATLAPFNFVENLELLGTGAINGTGNALANRLVGNDNANKLDGGLGTVGVDTLEGGDGNDTYVVNSSGDVVTEAANKGTDLVLSSVSFTLSADVENLELKGSANVNGTGNGSANTITGNGAKNYIDGGAGNDTMKGLGGDDTYVVGTGDVVEELSGQGFDTIRSSSNYTLSTNTGTGGTGFIENLVLTGSAIQGTGNKLDNKITGNASSNLLNGMDGADWLDGSSGNDTLIGGAGNDTYVIHNGGETIQETLTGTAGGTDTVRSSQNYTLGNNVENLILTGSAINGTGNALGNSISGNGSANVLKGEAGNDTLNGSTGNDELWGGSGRDIFVFSTTLNATTNFDTVKDYSLADDSIRLARSIFTAIGTSLETGELRIGSAAADSTDRIIYNASNGELSYDEDGIGAIAAIKFAKIASGLALTVSEFILS